MMDFAHAMPPHHTLETARQGKLYLVPSPLDFGCAAEQSTPLSHVLPDGTLKTAAMLTHWICENAKSCRATLKRIAQHHPLPCPLQAMNITELPRADHHSSASNSAPKPAAQALLECALQGVDIGLMSEAGMPAIADPGALIVQAAHRLGIEVVPLVGPVSIVLALAASGLNGQHFAFQGYLPQNALERKNRIVQLEKIALQTGQTQLFIETPYRNLALLQSLIDALQPTTRLACSIGVTLPGARSISQTVQAWRASPKLAADIFNPSLPTIFMFGRAA